MSRRQRLDRLPHRALPGAGLLHVAASPWARLAGLARLPALPADRALLLPGCRSIHTVGMNFVLDLIWLDATGRPLRLDREVARRRVRSCRGAAAVVEVTTGAGACWAAALAAHASGASASAGLPEPGVPPEERSVRLALSSGG